MLCSLYVISLGICVDSVHCCAAQQMLLERVSYECTNADMERKKTAFHTLITHKPTEAIYIYHTHM